jgi:hypothetical protein
MPRRGTCRKVRDGTAGAEAWEVPARGDRVFGLAAVLFILRRREGTGVAEAAE